MDSREVADRAATGEGHRIEAAEGAVAEIFRTHQRGGPIFDRGTVTWRGYGGTRSQRTYVRRSYSHWIRIAVSLTLVQFRLALAGWWRWTRIETAW